MADAEAICEAVSRPNMRFVAIKNVEQQAILSLAVMPEDSYILTNTGHDLQTTIHQVQTTIHQVQTTVHYVRANNECHKS